MRRMRGRGSLYDMYVACDGLENTYRGLFLEWSGSCMMLRSDSHSVMDLLYVRDVLEMRDMGCYTLATRTVAFQSRL